ncbi:MAG TPA: Co2+/Mg2+ efflux protein ApaG [Gammaproteobacteria bacterium]|nr:Co2+/Mg2+ efflux protein ApaG [Gammaproteobacteria bacterium]
MGSLRREITVNVESSFLAGESEPEDSRYVFGYTVTLANTGDIGARLLTRHWIITDADGEVREVHGEGVVGEAPYLTPGAGFRYSSGAVLATPVGTMHGSYQWIGDDGVPFDAPIPMFRLAVPGLLH